MIKRNSFIGIVVILALVICVANGQTWITLQPGFNDSSYSVTVISSDYDSTVIDIDMPGIYYEDTIVGGSTYKIISLPGPTFFYSDTLTHPRLPKINIPIAVPGTKGISVTTVDSAETTFTDWLIYPSAHVYDSVSSDSLGNIDSAYISCFEIDSSFYQGTGTYPDSNASRSYPYIVNGARGINLVFIPFKYSKGDTSLKAISNYRIKLTYSGTDSSNCLDTDTFTVSPSDTQGLAMLFCNFRSFSLLEPEDFGNYYILTTEPWAEILELTGIREAFIDWREAMGFNVHIVRVTPDGEEFYDIKEDLMGYFPRPTIDDYVLVVGDRGIESGLSWWPYTDDPICSDLIMIEDDDENGEDFFIDDVDGNYFDNHWYSIRSLSSITCSDPPVLTDVRYPALYFGRAPVQSADQLIWWINKVRTYELIEPPSYLRYDLWDWDEVISTGWSIPFFPVNAVEGFKLYLTMSTSLIDIGHADKATFETEAEGYGIGVTAIRTPLSYSGSLGNHWHHLYGMGGGGDDCFSHWQNPGNPQMDVPLSGWHHMSCATFCFGDYQSTLTGWSGAEACGEQGCGYGRELTSRGPNWGFWWMACLYGRMAGINSYEVDARTAINSHSESLGGFLATCDRITHAINAADIYLIGTTFNPIYVATTAEETAKRDVIIPSDFLGDPALKLWTDEPEGSRVTSHYAIDDPTSGTIDIVAHVEDEGASSIEVAPVCCWNGSYDISNHTYDNKFHKVKWTNSSGNATFTLLHSEADAGDIIKLTTTKRNYIPDQWEIIVGGDRRIHYADARGDYSNIGSPRSSAGNTCSFPADSVFPGDSIFWFDPHFGEYVRWDSNKLDPGIAYWVFAAVADTDSCYYVHIDTFRVQLYTGWNLVSPTDSNRTWDGNFSLDTDVEEILSGPIALDTCGNYLFLEDDTIRATYGYWIYSSDTTTLTFPASGSDTNYIAENWKLISTIPNPPHIQDTAHFSPSFDWANDTIEVTHKETSNPVHYAMVVAQLGDSIEYGFTDSDGKVAFDFDINVSDTCWIYIHKIGFVDYTVHPYGTISNGDTMWGDVYIYGDVVAESGDTLTILPGTNIYMKPTSAVWNYAYDVNNRTEIMAYGGHVQVYGTEEDPVHFRPGSGGSGLYQWGGLWAKVGGSFDVRYAQFDSCDGVGGYNGGNGPGRLKLTHTRHIGNQGVFGSWNGAGTIDGWFQMDSCYVEGRAMWYSNEDSCWARACSLSGSVSAGESYYTYNCATAPEIEDCIIFDYNYRGGRAYGETNFSRSVFDGTGPAAYNYKKVGFQNCDIIANNGSYALFITSSADASGSVTADSTRFRNFNNTGVYSYKDLDFGKYNCFIRDDATYTVDGNGVVMTTDSCYFDSLWVGYVKLTNNNRVDFCISDPTLSKVLGPDGKHILPENFSLGNAVPNPFNSTVAIEIDVPKDAEVVFEIFNILGDKIITLVDEKLGRGRYKIVWDGHDSANRELPSGTYLYRLRSDDFQETKKMTLVK